MYGIFYSTYIFLHRLHLKTLSLLPLCKLLKFVRKKYFYLGLKPYCIKHFVVLLLRNPELRVYVVLFIYWSRDFTKLLLPRDIWLSRLRSFSLCADILLVLKMKKKQKKLICPKEKWKMGLFMPPQSNASSLTIRMREGGSCTSQYPYVDFSIYAKTGQLGVTL